MFERNYRQVQAAAKRVVGRKCVNSEHRHADAITDSCLEPAIKALSQEVKKTRRLNDIRAE